MEALNHHGQLTATYRHLLAVEAAVVAGAGAWLLTRRDQRVATPH